MRNDRSGSSPAGTLDQSSPSNFLSVPMSGLACTADRIDRNANVAIGRIAVVRSNIGDRLVLAGMTRSGSPKPAIVCAHFFPLCGKANLSLANSDTHCYLTRKPPAVIWFEREFRALGEKNSLGCHLQFGSARGRADANVTRMSVTFWSRCTREDRFRSPNRLKLHQQCRHRKWSTAFFQSTAVFGSGCEQKKCLQIMVGDAGFEPATPAV